jgi:hypothetical protein
MAIQLLYLVPCLSTDAPFSCTVCLLYSGVFSAEVVARDASTGVPRNEVMKLLRHTNHRR